MTRKLAILFIFVILCILSSPFTGAMEIEDEVLENPAGVNELTVQILQYGLVGIDGNPTKFIISLDIPQDDERQDVDTDVNKVKDELGTETGVIEEDNPSNPFAYTISSVVKSRANHLTSLPSSYVIPEDVEIYLQPTENIQSSDPRFRDLAGEVTKDSRDDFEKVAKLAMWVYDYMTYDLSYSNRNF
ncbi:MAG: transglutaminase family protein, partial [Candidatus Aenigmarchaeota archaeon]|nr:transglutaminase family protein [Candidatus Aenigmarchaeota archaeon]